MINVLALLGDGTPFTPGMTIYDLDGKLIDTTPCSIEYYESERAWRLYITKPDRGFVGIGNVNQYYSSLETARKAKATTLRTELTQLETLMRQTQAELAALGA